MVVVVVLVLEGVEDLIGSLVETVTDAVVVALVVVVSHIKAVTATFAGLVDGALDVDFDLFVESNTLTLGVAGGWELPRTGALFLPTGLSVLLCERSSAVAVVSLGYVDASVVGGLITVVDTVLDVDLGLSVPLERFTVP